MNRHHILAFISSAPNMMRFHCVNIPSQRNNKLKARYCPGIAWLGCSQASMSRMQNVTLHISEFVTNLFILQHSKCLRSFMSTSTYTNLPFASHMAVCIVVCCCSNTHFTHYLHTFIRTICTFIVVMDCVPLSTISCLNQK